MADVCITEYTDPGCPWAYSAEPFRRRLSWLYGDGARVARPPGRARRVARRVRRARLHARAPVAAPSRRSRATTACRSTRRCARAWRRRCPPAAPSSPPACTRPSAMRRLLRRLRVRHFAGELLDEPADDRRRRARRRHRPGRPRALDGAATTSRRRCARTWPRRAHPIDAARVLDEKLANWSGGRRYTCPSYEIVRARRRREDRGPGLPAVRRLRRRDRRTSCPASTGATAPESVEEVLALDRHAAGDEGGRGGVRHRLRRGARALGRVGGRAARRRRRLLVARRRSLSPRPAVPGSRRRFAGANDPHVRLARTRSRRLPRPDGGARRGDRRCIRSCPLRGVRRAGR